MSNLSKEEIILAFNLWMQDYINNDEKYLTKEDAINDFVAKKLAGEEPNYGNTCYATLEYFYEKFKEEKYVAK